MGLYVSIIRRSNLCLSHAYMDLCCSECYYSCLYFVPIYVSVCVMNCLLNVFAICVDGVTVLSVRVSVLL